MISDTEMSNSTKDNILFIFYIKAVEEEACKMEARQTYKLHKKIATNYATVTFEGNEKITCTAGGFRSNALGVGHAERYALAYAINEAILKKWPIFLECQQILNNKFNCTIINTSLFQKLEIQKQYELFRIFKPALDSLTSITIYTEREPCNNSKYSCENFLNEILNSSKYKIYYSMPYVSLAWEQRNLIIYKVNELDSLMQYTDTQLQLEGGLLDPFMQYYYSYYQRNYKTLDEYVEKLELILQYKGILTDKKVVNSAFIEELKAVLIKKEMTNEFYDKTKDLTKVNETTIANIYQALIKEENALNIKITRISDEIKKTEEAIENFDEEVRYPENKKKSLNNRA